MPGPRAMLFRFCLYGFLKNQRYFEPFLVLAVLAKGLDFLAFGTLVAIREATVHVFEIPSGAVADLFGRRRALLLAFAAYLASFAAFAWADGFWALAAAMAAFGVGEAFRSGSHKAMIFVWLELQGRTGEKTRVYGLTRSWSKFGSALSALVAAGLVFGAADYTVVFAWSLPPCLLSIANLATYPAAIDPLPEAPARPRAVLAHLTRALRDAAGRPRLRRLLVESMGFNGLFLAAKDYLQPLLAAAAAAWWLGTSIAGDTAAVRHTALMSGAVYFALFFAAGLASRHAHRFAAWAGGDDAGARRLWTLLAAAAAAIALSDAPGVPAAAMAVAIAGFACLHVLQNLWRPIMTSRIYDEVDKAQGSTVLSVESQANRVVVMVLAPALGWMVDTAGAFWPVGAVAVVVACALRSLPRP